MQSSSSDVGNKRKVQADSDLCIWVNEGQFIEDWEDWRETGVLEGKKSRFLFWI